MANDVDGGNFTNLVEIEAFGNFDIHVAYYPTDLRAKAKAFWQHTGEIISSRLAETALEGLCICGTSCLSVSVTPNYSGGLRRCRSDSISDGVLKPLCHVALKSRGIIAQDIIKARIAAVVGEPVSSIYLTVSGMAAIYSAYRSVRILKGNSSPVAVFGFPYLDTLKIMQRAEINPAGVYFFGFGDENDLKKLETLCAETSIAALFTELPSNPLLRCHDMLRLSALAEKHDFVLVVDDTISSFANVDLLRKGQGEKGEKGKVLADIVCSSLTKLFSGRGDVLGGSVVVNSSGRYATLLTRLFADPNILHIPDMFAIDAEILEKNSRDFVPRVQRINGTALRLAQWFQGRAEVKHVYYPGISPCKGSYDMIAKVWESAGTGYGCLMSIIVKESLCVKKLFDSLELHKGPSLGTDYTLVCPYVMLAHYCELEWAASFGLDSRIIRISVGLEDFDEIRKAFENAFEHANKQVSNI